MRGMYTREAIKRGVTAGSVIAVMMMTLVGFGMLNRSAGANTTVTGPRDCDNNAIIRCGALSTDELRQKYAADEPGDIPAVYQHFGISAADVESLDTKVTVGTVRADGTVWVDGKMIGVNAVTSGRNRTPNSTAIPGTNAFKRPPSDSFATPSTEIKIFIGFEGDEPSFAIMSSCGNPMTWDAADVNVQKMVSKDGSSWKDTETFASGEEVYFRVRVSETSGNIDVQDVTLRDELPAGYTFVSGSLTLNGSPAPDPVAGSSIALGKLQKSGTITAIYKAQLALTTKECGSETLTNTALVSGFMIADVSDSANARVQKTCVATVACGTLSHGTLPKTLEPGDIVTFELTEGGITNATISAYVFKVNNTVVQQDMRDTFVYATPSTGTFVVEGVIRTTEGDSQPSSSCTVTLTVEEEPTPNPDPDPDPEVRTVACTGLSGPTVLTVAQGGTYTVATTNSDRVAMHTFRVNGDIVGANGNTFTYTPLTTGDFTISATISPISGVTIAENGQATCSLDVRVNDTVVTACESLSLSASNILVGDVVTATAAAQATGTTASEYVFFINGQEQQRRISNVFTFTPPQGEHTIEVRVVFANGDVRTSADCSQNLTVVDDSVDVITACERLTGPVNLNDGDTVTYTVTAVATGTSVERYIFELNGTIVQQTEANTYELTAIDGVHTLRASVVFANGDTKTSNACTQRIRVETDVPDPDKPDEDTAVTVCRNGVSIVIFEDERLASDTDAPCPQVEGDQDNGTDNTVDELPDTGGSADTIAGLATALSGAGVIGYRRYAIRKF